MPKRSEDRLRRNKPEQKQQVSMPVEKVVIPAQAKEWSASAKRLWRALKKSEFAKMFYRNTDWAAAYFIVGEISRYEFAGRQNGQVLQALLSGLGSLGLTEGDRRRMGIELSAVGVGATEDKDSRVVVMDAWRERANGI